MTSLGRAFRRMVRRERPQGRMDADGWVLGELDRVPLPQREHPLLLMEPDWYVHGGAIRPAGLTLSGAAPYTPYDPNMPGAHDPISNVRASLGHIMRRYGPEAADGPSQDEFPSTAPVATPCPRWSLEEQHGPHEWDAPVDGWSACPGWRGMD